MSFIFPRQVVLEQKILKDFSYIFLCKILIGHCGHDLNKLELTLPEDASL